MSRIALLACASFLVLTGCASAESAACPTTAPANPAFVPPSPSPPQSPYETMFWHGNKNLWTLLPLDGALNVKALPFWSPDYDVHAENYPDFRLVARPLDTDQAPITFDIQATNASFPKLGEAGYAILMPFPSLEDGCWQLTGSYAGHSLSFVAEVAPTLP